MTEVTWEALWQERVGKFAEACGKEMDEVVDALKAVVGEPGQQALDILADEAASSVAELKGVLCSDGPKIPSGVFNKNLALLRGPKVAPEVPANPVVGAGMSMSVLPSVPDDTSFIEMLKVGGELKVGITEVISALRAALAARVGLYDLPEKLKTKMEAFAEANDEPVGEEFFKLRTLVIKRNYADVLSVLGIEGQFISESRKNKFLDRLEQNLWQSLYEFHQRISDWQRAYVEAGANPAILMSAVATLMGGGGMVPGAMAPGMMAPPDTSILRDTAENVINQINKVFAGVGIPVARAMAYDALRIKDVLMHPGLPASIGAANREQMLRMLEADVASDYPRMERNVTTYAMAIMEFPKVTAGQDELIYIGAMLQLGLSIPWEKLMKRKLEAGGSGPKRNPERY